MNDNYFYFVVNINTLNLLSLNMQKHNLFQYISCFTCPTELCSINNDLYFRN